MQIDLSPSQAITPSSVYDEGGVLHFASPQFPGTSSSRYVFTQLSGLLQPEESIRLLNVTASLNRRDHSTHPSKLNISVTSHVCVIHNMQIPLRLGSESSAVSNGPRAVHPSLHPQTASPSPSPTSRQAPENSDTRTA